MSIEIILYGQPVTKKNSMIRTSWGGIIQSKAYREYAEDCRRQIDVIYEGQRSITDNVLLTVKYYIKTKRYPDLLNLLQATCDIISDQKKNGVVIWNGIIADDKQIIGYNHSRIMGIDKDNPRAEIKIISIAKRSK